MTSSILSLLNSESKKGPVEKLDLNTNKVVIRKVNHSKVADNRIIVSSDKKATKSDNENSENSDPVIYTKTNTENLPKDIGFKTDLEIKHANPYAAMGYILGNNAIPYGSPHHSSQKHTKNKGQRHARFYVQSSPGVVVNGQINYGNHIQNPHVSQNNNIHLYFRGTQNSVHPELVINNTLSNIQSGHNSFPCYKTHSCNYFYIQSGMYHAPFHMVPNMVMPPTNKAQKTEDINNPNQVQIKDKKTKKVNIAQFLEDRLILDDEVIKCHHSLPLKKNYINVPKSIEFDDGTGRILKFRCTCHDAPHKKKLIQCHSCQNFLHALCVNIGIVDPSRPFICPFCTKKRIMCSCCEKDEREILNYSVPIVQCVKCGNWVHKECIGFGFGPIPDDVECHRCCENKCYKFPEIKLPRSVNDVDMSTLEEKFDITENLPEGSFRNAIFDLFNKSEANYTDYLIDMFRTFSTNFLSRNQEFWRNFINVTKAIFDVKESTIFKDISKIVFSLFYRPFEIKKYNYVPFTYGESTSDFFTKLDCLKVDAPLSPVSLYLDLDNFVRTPIKLFPNQFIHDMPGYILHEDEVDCDGKIPLNIFAIHETNLVVDMAGTDIDIVRHIKRGYNANTKVDFYMLNDEVRVGLFVNFENLCADDKSKFSHISENSELVLPIDCEVPYPLDSEEWKFKRGRQNKRSKKNDAPEFTLLTAFLDDDIPPLPYIITNAPLRRKRTR